MEKIIDQFYSIEEQIVLCEYFGLDAPSLMKIDEYRDEYEVSTYEIYEEMEVTYESPFATPEGIAAAEVLMKNYEVIDFSMFPGFSLEGIIVTPKENKEDITKKLLKPQPICSIVLEYSGGMIPEYESYSAIFVPFYKKIVVIAHVSSIIHKCNNIALGYYDSTERSYGSFLKNCKPFLCNWWKKTFEYTHPDYCMYTKEDGYEIWRSVSSEGLISKETLLSWKQEIMDEYFKSDEDLEDWEEDDI